MKYFLLAALLTGLLLPASAASAKDNIMKEEGITTIPSHHSVDETVDRFRKSCDMTHEARMITLACQRSDASTCQSMQCDALQTILGINLQAASS